MSTKKILLCGCGAISFIALVIAGLFVGFLFHIAQDVEGVTVSIDAPLDVKIGETFNMTVNVTNERDKKDLALSDIDISDDYMAGFIVASTEPTSKSNEHISDSLSYTFDTEIPAGESVSFVFVLRAEQEGVFRGDVSVYEGIRFISATAQSVVKE